MISILIAIIFFTWLGRAALRRPAFLFVGIFLIWQFFLKVAGIVYLDVAGPIYSDEVFTYVGGDGSSAPLLIFFVWIPLVFIYSMLGPNASAKPLRPERYLQLGGITFADLVIVLLGVFVVLLYGDMLIGGDIPFFSGTERFNYSGGMFHNFFMDFMFLITFLLGYIFARARILVGVWDLRCIALLFALFVYLFLAGHRFGAFYVMASFIGLALSALYFMKDQGWSVAPAAKASMTQRVVQSPAAIAVACLLVAGLVAAAMINNLFFVREYGETAGEELIHRLFVQPVHLYWLTWFRLQGGDVSGSEAIEFMFYNPFDIAKNTGIQYLMFRSLGEERASMIFLDQQTDYAGGYPEIAIELGGIWACALIACVGSLFTACLYRLCIFSLCRGHFLTSMFSIYVCYGFLGFYLGGMINFLLTWTYWVKFVLLIVALIIDRVLEHSELRLFPWVIFPRRAFYSAEKPCSSQNCVRMSIKICKKTA